MANKTSSVTPDPVVETTAAAKDVAKAETKKKETRYIYIEKKQGQFANIPIQPFSVIKKEHYDLIIGKEPEAAAHFRTLDEYTKEKGELFTPRKIV